MGVKAELIIQLAIEEADLRLVLWCSCQYAGDKSYNGSSHQNRDQRVSCHRRSESIRHGPD